jgi:hypothetical protein
MAEKTEAGSEDLLLEMHERLGALEDRIAALDSDRAAFDEGLGGRLMTVEEKLRDFAALLESGQGGAPDLLARNILRPVLALLAAQRTSLPASQLAHARAALEAGRDLLAPPKLPHTPVNRQAAAQILTRP